MRKTLAIVGVAMLSAWLAWAACDTQDEPPDIGAPGEPVSISLIEHALDVIWDYQDCLEAWELFTYALGADMTPENSAAVVIGDGDRNMLFNSLFIVTPTSTATPTASATPTSTTPTATMTPTASPTYTSTATPTLTPTATLSPTVNPTTGPSTPTKTPTSTPTDTPTNTPTSTPTYTPTETPTQSPTATFTVTVTPTAIQHWDADGINAVEVKPSDMMYTYSISKAMAGSTYASMAGGLQCSATIGIPQPGDGSILGACFFVDVIAHTVNGTATIEVKVNDAIQFSKAFTVTGTGVQVDCLSYARDTYTFAEDDLIQVDYTLTSGTFSAKVACSVRAVLD